MTDKTQPTELRTEIVRYLRIVRDDGALDDNSGGESWHHSDRSIEDAADQLIALFSKTIATKTREAVDNLLDEMITVQERHLTEAVRVSGREEAKDTLGWLRGWRKAQLKPPTGEK